MSDYKETIEVLSKVCMVAQAMDDTVTAKALNHAINCVKLADEMQWQPIETALKDGDIILVMRKVGFSLEYIHASYWCGNGWYLPFDSERDSDGTPLLGENEQPTHWMLLPKGIPLPKIPKKGTEE
jgi:hypothetical protein